MTRRWMILAGLCLAALLGGCAHPISLNSDLSTVTGTGKDKIDKSVGLYVSAADRARQVEGPGGGGDKVSYFPYRDMEAGIYVALGEAFSKVSKLESTSDPRIAAEGIHYVITPSLVTTSHSPSLFTWPPTVFTIEITCRIQDAQGKPVTEIRVMGDGRAEFDEFKSDFSMSAKRAANDALAKLVKAIGDAKGSLR